MSVNPGLLPNNSAPIDDQGGLATQEWRDFFLLLADGAESEELAAEYAALADRVAALEQDGGQYLPIDTTAVGVNSVTQSGTLAGGYIAFSLRGDVDAPAADSYYGTDASAALGYWPLPTGGGGVPYFVPDGENYTVPANIQALWKLPIALGVGSSLTVLGALEQVD